MGGMDFWVGWGVAELGFVWLFQLTGQELVLTDDSVENGYLPDYILRGLRRLGRVDVP